MKLSHTIITFTFAAVATIGAERESPRQPSSESQQPCTVKRAPAISNDMPFAGGNLFTDNYENPIKKHEKRLWAASFLYCEAPRIDVEQWLGEKPDMNGKYVLLEVWNTWCPPCRRSIQLLNQLHAKFGKELVVVALCDEDPEVVAAMTKDGQHKMVCFNAVDTQGRTRNALNVVGVPHAIVIEPGGYVVWEGFPLQPGFELTENTVEKILAVGRATK